MILENIGLAVQKGDVRNISSLVNEALSLEISADEVLNKGLLAGMSIIGERFKNNEVFVPEVLMAARTMNEGTKILEEELLKLGTKSVGTAIIGTVKGDLHDIGKNLVGMMLKAAGFKVIDIGVNCEAEKYIASAEENNANIIVLSALLTTTMEYMGTVIKELEARGLRDKYKVMVGGAPVNEEFSRKIGADYYTTDATSCSEQARKAVVA